MHGAIAWALTDLTRIDPNRLWLILAVGVPLAGASTVVQSILFESYYCTCIVHIVCTQIEVLNLSSGARAMFQYGDWLDKTKENPTATVVLLEATSEEAKAKRTKVRSDMPGSA